jgi:DNA-directed RNA polymerase specialized sigma24 family protein
MAAALAFTPSIRDQFLSSPALRAKLTRVFSGRVLEGDVEDFVQETLLEASGEPLVPLDDEETCHQYVCGMGRKIAADDRRLNSRLKRRRDTESLDEGTVACPKPNPASSFESKELLRKAARATLRRPSDWQAFVWLFRSACGESLAYIAGEEGGEYAAIRKTVSRLRRKLELRVTQLTLVAAAAALIIGFVLRAMHGPQKDDANDPNAPIVPNTMHSEQEDPNARAHGARRIAYEACDRGEWIVCLNKLDQAKTDDPAGESDMRVRDARARAIEGLRESIKDVKVGGGKVDDVRSR